MTVESLLALLLMFLALLALVVFLLVVGIVTEDYGTPQGHHPYSPRDFGLQRHKWGPREESVGC